MSVPKVYQNLTKLKGPKIIVEAMKLFGTLEVPGSKSNPVILAWAKVLGLSKIYVNDGIAWCGLAMAYVCHMAGKPIPLNPLWALNWQFWGITVKKGDERRGDILVFERRDARGKLIGGHVGIYVAEDKTHFHVLGGNESDSFIIVRIAKERLVACRRPQYVNMPPECVKVYVDPTGVPVSNNES